MSLVVITADGLEHHYVSNQILAQQDVKAILVCDPPLRRSWTKTLRRSPRRFFDKFLRKAYLQAIGDAKARSVSLKRVLGQQCESFDCENLVVRVGLPKSGALKKKVEEIQPDVIAIYGTGIIPGDVLSLSKNISLNMHTGLSPWYRGTACAFWPIFDGKPEFVGATVHECTNVVDGGKIFFSSRADLFFGDDLHSVFARSVKVGAEGYVEVIGKALADKLVGTRQDLSVGKEYNGAMLGFWAEWNARRSLRQLSKTWPKEEAPRPDSAS